MTRKHGSKSEAVRKVTKTGAYTYYVTIPKQLIQELGWRERQRVVVKRIGTRLEIRDYKAKHDRT